MANKTKSKLTAALVAVFLCLNVSAETTLKFGGFSHHLSEGDYNSFHRVLILNHNGYFGGYFKNSYYDDSFTLGYRWHLKTDSLFNFGLSTALVYGYRESSGCYKKQDKREKDPKRLCFMVSPDATLYSHKIRPSFALFGADAFTLTFDVGL